MWKSSRVGSIAQLVEHMPYKHGVTGSSPVVPTIPKLPGAVVQLVRTPACHAGGRGFKSLPRRHFISFERHLFVPPSDEAKAPFVSPFAQQFFLHRLRVGRKDLPL